MSGSQRLTSPKGYSKHKKAKVQNKGTDVLLIPSFACLFPTFESVLREAIMQQKIDALPPEAFASVPGIAGKRGCSTAREAKASPLSLCRSSSVVRRMIRSISRVVNPGNVKLTNFHFRQNKRLSRSYFIRQRHFRMSMADEKWLFDHLTILSWFVSVWIA